MSDQARMRLAIASLLGSVALWALLTDAWGWSERLLSGRTALYAILSRLVWMAPAVLLILRRGAELRWSPRELFSRPRPEPVFLVFLALVAAWGLARLIITRRAPRLSGGEAAYLTAKLLLVGVCEETVFRGWGYNLLRRSRSRAVATVASALPFMLLHWPAYLARFLLGGPMDWAGLAAQSAAVCVCALLFSWMLERGGTLWSPILAHCIYDWVLTLLG